MVFIVKSTNDVCIAITVSQGLLCSVSRYLCTYIQVWLFTIAFQKFWDSVYTRGSPEEDRCCVHVLPISSEALWGEKKENSESSRRASARNMSVHFFFAFGAAAVANCYRATLCLAEQKNIFLHFVQKYQDITAHSFHFWHFFSVEDLREKKRKF